MSSYVKVLWNWHVGMFRWHVVVVWLFCDCLWYGKALYCMVWYVHWTIPKKIFKIILLFSISFSIFRFALQKNSKKKKKRIKSPKQQYWKNKTIWVKYSSTTHKLKEWLQRVWLQQQSLDCSLYGMKWKEDEE